MNKFTRSLLACLCFGIATMASSPAFAETSNKTKTAKTTKSAKTSKSVKVKQDKGSAESVTERERRLKRECKGQVNAGACAGFTR